MCTHLICESFIENMKLKFAFKQLKLAFKVCCPIICRDYIYYVWFTVVLVFGNKQVAVIKIDCIQLQWGI